MDDALASLHTVHVVSRVLRHHNQVLLVTAKGTNLTRLVLECDFLHRALSHVLLFEDSEEPKKLSDRLIELTLTSVPPL